MSRHITGKIVLYLLVLTLVDFCFMPALAGWMVVPTLTYLMIPYAAFEWNWTKTLSMAVAVGLIRDLTGNGPLGLETVSLILASLLLDFSLQKMESKTSLMRLAFIFLFVFVELMIMSLLSGFLSPAFHFSWHMMTISFHAALVSAILSPLFGYLTGFLFRNPEEVSSLKPLKQYELFG